MQCSGACVIQVGDHLIETGGYEIEKGGASNTTAKYDQSGRIENLPTLKQERMDHACSSFISDNGGTVRFINVITLFKPLFL